MASVSLLLGLLPVLAAGVGFQDGVVAVAARDDVLAARQANGGAFYCSAIGELFSLCNIGTISMGSSDAADCLCYSSTSWVPQVFDAAVSSCADYAYSELPADAYSLATAFEGFCTSVGDVKKNPSPAASRSGSIAPVTPTPTPVVPVGSTTSPKPTPVATTPAVKPASSASASASGSVNIFSNSACSFVSFALSFCNSATPGFSTMDVSSQAPCLCYSSTKWSPNGFDGPVKTCADFVSTAEPAAYTDFVAVEGFCSSVGDVEGAAATAGASATKSSGGGSGGGSGGIGLTVPGPAKSTTSKTSSTPTVTTTPRTTPVQSPAQSPAATTSKTGAAAPPNDSSMTWAFRLAFVAISAMLLL